VWRKWGAGGLAEEHESDKIQITKSIQILSQNNGLGIKIGIFKSEKVSHKKMYDGNKRRKKEN